jgi:hypothetical protein
VLLGGTVEARRQHARVELAQRAADGDAAVVAEVARIALLEDGRDRRGRPSRWVAARRERRRQDGVFTILVF